MRDSVFYLNPLLVPQMARSNLLFFFGWGRGGGGMGGGGKVAIVLVGVPV